MVAKLLPYVDAIDCCPEMDIGLGVPRDPVRLLRGSSDSEVRMVQPASGRDLTEEMREYSSGLLDPIRALDGAVLKSRSPSCAVREAKVYRSADSSEVLGKGPGLFAAEVLRRMPEWLVTTEGRLRNFALREHWLTCVFTMARLRAASLECSEARSIGPLVSFHAAHKLLFLAHGRRGMVLLGRIAANPEGRSVRDVITSYAEALPSAIGRNPSRGRTVDVLQHAMGCFKRSVSSEERSHFMGLLGMYRSKQLPLSACTSVLGSWIARERETYLAGQVFFRPYPVGLIEVSDSGKGRDL